MKSYKRIAIVAVVLALAVFATACSFSVSTANIQDAIMTNSIDAEGKPGEEVVSFTADAAILYTSAKIMNAPDNTQIRIVWTYVTGNEAMGEITVDSGDISDRYIYSNYEPTAILPEGDYQVQYFIDDREEPDATVKFVVLPANNLSMDEGAAAAGFTLYSQAEGGYSFNYPTEWTLQEFPEDMAAWVYPADFSVTGEDDLNTVYVIANKDLAQGYTIDTLLQGWVDETNAEGIENYAYIAQSVDNIDGRDIASFSYSWTRGDYQLYTVDALLIDGSDFYVLSFTVTQEAYDALYPLFEQMALSFQIL